MHTTRLPINDQRRTSGDPHESLALAVSISRFWRLIDRADPDECWPYTGHLDRGGYGIFTDHLGKRRPAHELALSYTTGEVKHEGLETCHSCDNPQCCNPNHLRFDTRQSNVDDMVSRKRNRVGSRAPHTALTEDDVLLIRERRALGARVRDLSIDFGISESAVSAIVHGKNWKHVGGPITNRKISRTRKAA